MLKGLVLDAKHKEVLAATFQAQELAWKIDFIENKGEGQTILLYGPPGVGKTYTVEAFSEATSRPLIFLSMADIGMDDRFSESLLAKWFHLTERWNAVLLVDEADIFLEKRTKADVERNALVSVFLRRMEYFKGLFFLTTNRIGHIDDAFLSRVNVVIGYDSLTDDTRRQLWNGFFNKLQKDMETRSKEGKKPIIQIDRYCCSAAAWWTLTRDPPYICSSIASASVF